MRNILQKNCQEFNTKYIFVNSEILTLNHKFPKATIFLFIDISHCTDQFHNYYYYYYYYYYYFYSYTRKRFYRITFKLEDIHRHKFCTTTFFICHYTDIGNGECQPRIGLFTPFKNKFQ